ncbi:COR domain-containing protein [Lentzea nigeriaca]|uniref:COR domain-containing protein n=1 Tax=Lentzea nigeriaca TaxID=1128665 RepID=UPI00195E6669|nr:COR domain-containing protein [Lentzea nigeriaca]MBM7864451.1 GTPase SAR1 family protein [Lentzea nigeriaca]
MTPDYLPERNVLTGDEKYRQALLAIEGGDPTVDLAYVGMDELDPRRHLHGGIVNLDIYNNALRRLPDQVGELLALECLDASDNDLTELPASLTNLAQLSALNVSLNKISRLPADIQKLANLRSLNVSDNDLEELPARIGGLSALEELDVSGNRLTALPARFGRLHRLRVLDASYNGLRTLTDDLCQLRELEELLLYRNRIRRLSADLGQLRLLRVLDLSYNALRELPAEVGALRNLESLRLAGNALTEVPAGVGKLSGLRELDLSNNLLTRLPRELGYLPQGILLRLGGNPLVEPYSTLLGRGVPALLSYLRSLEDSAPQYEAKVLLVGEGGVGKSSLIAALRDDEFVHNRPTTHGIEIGRLDLPHPELDARLTLNTWDFGGQEVYRITHQFFFSRRALYLCVWKPREGQLENGVESWCRRIRLRVADQARLIVVATHASERRAEFDFGHLKSKFPHLVVDYFRVDSETGEGIAELRAAIARHAAELPQMGELLNNSWREARDEVLAHTESHITRLKFERVCASHGLSEDSTATLAGLMHDLGHIINYADDDGLRDLVVLRPEWLTKAIGYVLEDEFTRENAGELPHDRLSTVWSPGGVPLYPSEFHPYFLRLMEKFDVSYRLPDSRASLVAQLVPYERPKHIWQDKAVDVEPRRRVIRAICRTAEEAPGLIAWLTVRNHRFSVGKHWRRGVVLRHEEHDSEALFELMSNDRDLRLTVFGPAPEHFFHVLKDGVEDLIHHRWKGLTYEFLVPCGKTESDGTRCVGVFPYRALVKFRQRRERRIICTSCASWSDVEELISGLSQPTGSLEFMVRNVHRTLVQQQEQLSRMEASIATSARFRQVFEAETSRHLRIALRMLSAEVTDCPRLFTIAPADRKAVVHAMSTRLHYKITLWCEESGHEHPWPNATYDFKPTKEWITTIGPYVRFIAGMLRFVVPVAGAVYATTLTKDELELVKADIELTKTLADKLPQSQGESTTSLPQGMTRAEGAGLRTLRSLLLALDPVSAFGDLRRVHTPSGDIAWVCPHHHNLYDPGLPELPAG